MRSDVVWEDYPAFDIHCHPAPLQRADRRGADFLQGKRIRSGQAAARARGARFGNPTNIREAGGIGRATMTERADRFAADVLPVIEDIRAGGVTSLNGVAEELNRRGVSTPRGGRWAAMTVKRIVERGSGKAKG